MYSHQYEHISKIRSDFQASDRVKESLRNAIQTLAEDLYSKDTHFIFELIQNAEDNTYKDAEPFLSFQLVNQCPIDMQAPNGALIVQNNETGFTYENVDAICAVGKTTKSKSLGYIGEKGIGFKSVFKVSATPHIISNGYCFCLPEYDEETGLGYIVPRWLDNAEELPGNAQTTIVLPLNKNDFDYAVIEEMLRDIEPETILFLSKIEEIQIVTDTGDNLTILKDNKDLPLVQLLVEGEKQGKTFSTVAEFLLFTKTFEKPDHVHHEKRIDIDKRDVSVAFPLTHDTDQAGKLFAYLPVRSGTGLPFIINSDFILTSSREEIQINTPWNLWLMECVASLLEDVLPGLKERGLINVSFLENLARSINGIEAGSTFYPIAQAVYHVFSKEELLPADDGSFISADSAKLARGADLRNLLNQSQLQLLFESKREIKWLSGRITQDRTPALRDLLISRLRVEEITPEAFARKVTKEFFESQPDEWMLLFYQFIATRKDLWKAGKGYWNPPGPLFSKEFIRLQGDFHVSPFRADGSPSAYLGVESDRDTSLPIIKVGLSKIADIRQFFTKLGIPDLDIVVEVIENILPRYASQHVSIEEHRNDLLKIQRAYATDSQDKKNKLKEALRETPFILAENPALGTISYFKPSDVYFRNDELEDYFSHNHRIGFVSTEYNKDMLKIFEALGVTDDIRVNRTPSNRHGHVTITYSHGWHQRGLNGFDPDIRVDGLEEALAHPTMKVSAYIWNKIASVHSPCIRGEVQTSTRQSYDHPETKSHVSEFGSLLLETAWLPNERGDFVKPSELSLDELPESYIRDEKLADQLYMKKDSLVQLTDQFGIPAEDIELLLNYPEEFREWKKTILKSKKKPPFPLRDVLNPDRREEKVLDVLDNASEKEYEKRERSVRTTRGTIDPSLWLRNQYTNEEGEMVCQICKEEMPFRKRNGEYYFEAVEALSREYFIKESEAQYLALCPVCAAMYDEFIKKDEDSLAAFVNALSIAKTPEVDLVLGELMTTIRFVDSHFLDIKTILGKAKLP